MATEYGATRESGGTRLRGVIATVMRRPVALLLILLMVVGSVFLWIGVPFLWIYGVSHMVKTSQPTLGPYLIILVAMPISMWIVGKVLFRLNHLYTRVTGQSYQVRVQLPWHRSLRDQNMPRRATVLEVVMIGSVSVALLAFGIWFFFFAGSSLPNIS